MKQNAPPTAARFVIVRVMERSKLIPYRHRAPKILFVGINPHPGSYRRKVPFSNNKLFWYLMAASGLIREPKDILRDDAQLLHFYRTRFNQVYQLGLLNIIDRPTPNITTLVRGEEAKGRRRIDRVVSAQRPAVVCFVGKVVYEKYSGLKSFDFGWQPPIGSSRAFVMHYPLRGEAAVRIREFKMIAQAAGLQA